MIAIHKNPSANTIIGPANIENNSLVIEIR